MCTVYILLLAGYCVLHRERESKTWSVSCHVSADTPLPMQLASLYMKQNLLVGTLPESWSNLVNVSHCRQDVRLRIAVVANNQYDRKVSGQR